MNAISNRNGWLASLAQCLVLAAVLINPAKGEEAVSVSDAYNFKQVNDQLSTSGIINEEQLGQLSAEGYGAVISLLPADNQYAIAGEPKIVLSQGLTYNYIPVDFGGPTAEDYAAFAAAMDANKGKRTIVHCAANYRVTAFYSIYAVQNLGWSEDQAYELIGSIWDISEYPVWEEFVKEMLQQ